MVGYTMTQGDVEVGLEERMVVVVEKKSSSSAWMWKACVALLVVALCSAGALLFAWYWTGGPKTTAMMQQGETDALTEKQTGVIADARHTLRRISSNAKAAIHLEGSYEEDDSVKGVVEWRADQGQAFTQGGFRLEENRIVVPHTGLYFVYGQASFRVSCNDGAEESAAKHVVALPLSHRIWRYSDSIGSPVTLMSAVRSACQRTGDDDSYKVGQGWYNAIYLGAVFRLKQGDKLWTETNQLSQLESEEGRTFFGVFAL